MERKLIRVRDLRLGQRFWWASVLWTMGEEARAKRVSRNRAVAGRTRIFRPDEWVKADNKKK